MAATRQPHRQTAKSAGSREPRDNHVGGSSLLELQSEGSNRNDFGFAHWLDADLDIHARGERDVARAFANLRRILFGWRHEHVRLWLDARLLLQRVADEQV